MRTWSRRRPSRAVAKSATAGRATRTIARTAAATAPSGATRAPRMSAIGTVRAGSAKPVARRRDSSAARPRRAAACGARTRPKGGAAAVNAAASAAPRTARALLIGDVRQKREVARALDRGRQLALVEGGGTADTAREDLSALGDESREGLHVLEVDVADLLDRELADALAADEELLLDGFANGLGHGVSPDPSRVTRRGSRRPARPGAWWAWAKSTARRTPREEAGAAWG